MPELKPLQKAMIARDIAKKEGLLKTSTALDEVMRALDFQGQTRTIQPQDDIDDPLDTEFRNPVS